jgi:hypothetical protein
MLSRRPNKRGHEVSVAMNGAEGGSAPAMKKPGEV